MLQAHSSEKENQAVYTKLDCCIFFVLSRSGCAKGCVLLVLTTVRLLLCSARSTFDAQGP